MIGRLCFCELSCSLCKNISVDWEKRDSVRTKLRLLVKRILRKYKYPPDQQEDAINFVLQQAESLSAEWVGRFADINTKLE